MKKTVAVLFGGKSVEHTVSERSAAYLIGKLDPERYSPLPVGISKSGNFYLYHGEVARIADGTWETDSDNLTGTFPVRARGGRGFSVGCGLFEADAVLPALHGEYGEDGCMQGLLRLADLPFVGCGVAAGALCSDKDLTKRIARTLGIPVVPGFCPPIGADAERAYTDACRLLGEHTPLFIKPACLGSSVGAGTAQSREEFFLRYAEAKKYGKVLIEKDVHPTAEAEIAYFSDGTCEIYSKPGILRPDGFYSFDKKYGDGGVEGRIDCPPEQGVCDRLRAYAAALVGTVGIRHLCRIDFFLTDRGVYFNEINTFPGFTERSLYPRLIEQSGLSVTECLTRWLCHAEDRRL